MRRTPGASMPLPHDRLWTLAEAAEYLQMSESWVRRSEVPVVVLGRARRYDPAQVEAFARRRLTHRIIEPDEIRRPA